MGSDEEFIVLHDANNQPVKAKLVKYIQIKGEDPVYELEDGTKIRPKVEVDYIARPIDPKTGNFAVNPMTGEPVININWGLRVMTTYSEAALSGFRENNGK